ncbi:methyl-accepting chemotaxis protein [Marinimicrobium agarilyticum]|uniref:methyl-accepting chemotaxis protein n=1 Tax=Marinimicrobium agarilyticum TaxID=306546 RepID=UPI0004110289|nr:methyl-accepting chemotaxis protein [Marinimicrobium agarilyticum]
MGAINWPWGRGDAEEPLYELLQSRDLTRRLARQDASSLAIDQFVQELHHRIELSVSAAVTIAGEAPRLRKLAESADDNGQALTGAAGTFASTSEEVTATLEAELVPGAAEVARLSSQVATSLRQCEAGSESVLGNIRAISHSEQRLGSAIGELQAQLESVVNVISVIADISKQTNLLSLNAAIEAARAGVHGAGFAVVAEEVRRLAHHTTEATDEVAQIIDRFRQEVTQLTEAGHQMQGAVCDGEQGVTQLRTELGSVRSAMDQLDGQVSGMATGISQIGQAIGDLNQQVHTVSHAAADLRSSAQQMGTLGDAVHHQSDRLLEGLGGFQLELHREAQRKVEQLARDPALRQDDLPQTHAALRRALGRDKTFELAYLVDGAGQQLSDNIFCQALSHLDGTVARGTDWRERHWFKAVLSSGKPHITDVYRSDATDDFCFTVAVPVTMPGGTPRVLGVDVRLSALATSR